MVVNVGAVDTCLRMDPDDEPTRFAWDGTDLLLDASAPRSGTKGRGRELKAALVDALDAGAPASEAVANPDRITPPPRVLAGAP